MSDQLGTITWYKRVVPSMVEAFEIAGWVVEPVAPSHHDAHCVLMRYGGTVDPGEAPRIPVGRPRARQSYPGPLQRRGVSGRR